MSVKIYDSAGVYGAFTKAAERYDFDPSEGKTVQGISWGYGKSNEYDEYPNLFTPEAWDNFYMTRVITLTGVMTSKTGFELKDNMENLDKLSFHYRTVAFSDQPVFGTADTPLVYALEISLPKSNNTFENKLHWVTFDNLSFNFADGNRFVTFTVRFREVRNVYLI